MRRYLRWTYGPVRRYVFVLSEQIYDLRAARSVPTHFKGGLTKLNTRHVYVRTYLHVMGHVVATYVKHGLWLSVANHVGHAYMSR